MPKFFLIAISICCFYSALAQNSYDVKLIAPELLTHANVVKRMEEVRIEIKDAGSAIIYTKYALTILNAGGEDEANFTEHYSQLISIHNIDAALYDANGKKIKSLKKSDVKDVTGGESSLADDARYKIHNFNCSIYPYTVEYETEIEYKGIFFLPEWMPVEGENFSVEKSKLVVQCPLNYKLRFKTFNYPKDVVMVTARQALVYEWAIEKMPAIEKERYEPEWYEITPSVFLAPADFEIQHYTGNMTDWKGLGMFMYRLNLGRDILPENIKQQVHTLTDNLKTPTEKIKILYEYLQKNTRYISVQLGIGGWQTFDAAYVASNGYGDCKALSNYMYSLLKEAGIKACHVLIKAGTSQNSLMADFPSNQFNHAILCVPQATDTVWLECTSQTLPMGYLSGFTSNRNALLVDEAGGRLVHTPIYKKTDNVQARKIVATVNEEGQLTAAISTSYKAQQQDDLQGMLNAVSKEKVAEILKEQLSLASYDITKFEYNDEKSTLPVLNETLGLTAKNYCAISGKRLFIVPNVLNKSYSKIPGAATRKFAIEISYAFIDVDSVEIDIPAGYVPESLPGNTAIATKFGTYASTFKVNGGKIMYTRNLQQNSGLYPASDAVALAEYFQKIYMADRAKAVFVKEETK